eukprot:10096285-Ditylum_brightwellii.AAC.1
MSVSSEDNNKETITEHNSDNMSVRSMPDLMSHADNDDNSSVESEYRDEMLTDGVFVDDVARVNMEELWGSGITTLLMVKEMIPVEMGNYMISLKRMITILKETALT